MNAEHCTANEIVDAHLIRDPLGDYRVGLCPTCGRIVPFPLDVRHGQQQRIPQHRPRVVNI